jgi:DNA-binding MarR family transcriptional regulator
MAAPEDEQPVDVSALALLKLLRVITRAFRRGLEASPSVTDEPLRRAKEAGGLGERHFPILLTLALEGPATVNELARRVALAPATTSLLVNELSRAGIVEREEDDADRRRTIVSLPDRYRLPIEQRAAVRTAPLRRTLLRLEPEARVHFIAGLRILAEELIGESEQAAMPLRAAGEERSPR